MFVGGGVFVDQGGDDHHLKDGVFKGITVGMRIRMMLSPRQSCLLLSAGVESRHSRCNSSLVWTHSTVHWSTINCLPSKHCNQVLSLYQCVEEHSLIMLLPPKSSLLAFAKPTAFMDKVRNQRGHSLSFTLGELLVPFRMSAEGGAERLKIVLNVFMLLSVVNVWTEAQLAAVNAALTSVYSDPLKFGCKGCLARRSVCTWDLVTGR